MQILCATDFSKPAMDAADVAAALAKIMKLPLRLLHCGQDFIVMGDLPVAVADDQSVKDQLTRETERLRSSGIDVTEELRRGSPSIEIVAAASEKETNMIVLGSVGKGLAARWLVGSVAERVAESASVPTLVVRQGDLLRGWLDATAKLHLLCAVDFTTSADAAVRAMKDILTVGQSEVEAVYVRPPEDPVRTKEQTEMRQRDVWERLHTVLGDVPVKVHVRDVVGLPGAEFLHAADELKSGLLVVGTHQRHGWRRLKEPSFSRNVLAHATTNVLCVPAVTAAPNTIIPKIGRVLIATNFTSVCNDALRHALSLLPDGGAVHIIHVCPEPSSGINPIIASEVYFDHSMASDQAKTDAEVKMRELPADVLATPGVIFTSEVQSHYDVAAAICDAAEIYGADVICMGTKGHSRTGAALLGSTVQAVLARADKPVFVVTPPRA